MLPTNVNFPVPFSPSPLSGCFTYTRPVAPEAPAWPYRKKMGRTCCCVKNIKDFNVQVRRRLVNDSWVLMKFECRRRKNSSSTDLQLDIHPEINIRHVLQQECSLLRPISFTIEHLLTFEFSCAEISNCVQTRPIRAILSVSLHLYRYDDYIIARHYKLSNHWSISSDIFNLPWLHFRSVKQMKTNEMKDAKISMACFLWPLSTECLSCT